jgi:hypothetical protein
MHLDYPLWRQFIHDNRDKFAKVIVIFTNMNTGKDYRPWLQQELNKDGIISMSNDEVRAGDDWRNIAVNRGLTYSDSEWVWFTEQDYFPLEGFWGVVYTMSEASEVFGHFQDDRLHPCCIFIKRSLLNTTDRDFGVVRDKSDHFGLLQQELDFRNVPIGIISSYYGKHYNGLSQNMWMLMNNEEPNYQPDKFKEYCSDCLKIDLPIEPHIKEVLESYVGLN